MFYNFLIIIFSLFILVLTYYFMRSIIGLSSKSFKSFATKQQIRGMSSTTTNIHSFSAIDIDGNNIPFSQFQNKVILVVNVASQCGYTAQYSGLQELQNAYEQRGFSVIGFPCNQFGGQEPHCEVDIKNFAKGRYNVTFPMMSKIEVNGSSTHPIFEFLKQSCPGILNTTAIKWNFTKFLINKQGIPVERFGPSDTPSSLTSKIEQLL
eukprot:TRINITY_DN2353_c0_g1_i2.p1 TRINITY_DN2353_c0_g1~~TRINITY_DN2353_c0_g1_i2.p1  ORF type:complete len:208 (+),score=84.95 TRINITY_DN2353_c0_g1_i2:151-774(+)